MGSAQSVQVFWWTFSVAACSHLVYIKTKDTRVGSSKRKTWALWNIWCWTSPTQQASYRTRSLSRTTVRTPNLATPRRHSWEGRSWSGCSNRRVSRRFSPTFPQTPEVRCQQSGRQRVNVHHCVTSNLPEGCSELQIQVLCNVAPCRLLNTDRRFGRS